MTKVLVIPDQPILRPSLRDKNRYELVSPMLYISSDLPMGEVTVPIGYLTDGASIPWGFRGFVGQPFTPMYQSATVLHDYLYEHKLGTQKHADHLFLEILKHNGVGKGKRLLMFAALRLFGWIPWKIPNKKS